MNFTKALKSGLIGFLTITIILLVIDISSRIYGINKRVDTFDFIFASLGFLLQFGKSLIQDRS